MDSNPTIYQQLTTMVQQVGFPIVTAAYFMWRDYRLQQRNTDALEKIGESLAVIKDRLNGEEHG